MEVEKLDGGGVVVAFAGSHEVDHVVVLAKGGGPIVGSAVLVLAHVVEGRVANEIATDACGACPTLNKRMWLHNAELAQSRKARLAMRRRKSVVLSARSMIRSTRCGYIPALRVGAMIAGVVVGRWKKWEMEEGQTEMEEGNGSVI